MNAAEPPSDHRLRSGLIRGAVIVLLLTACGLATTVGVAWGAAATQDPYAPRPVSRNMREAPDSEWFIVRFEHRFGVAFSSLRQRVLTSYSPDPRSRDDMLELIEPWTGLDAPRTGYENEGVRREARVVEAWGWPRPALWSEHLVFEDEIFGGVRTNLPLRKLSGLGPQLVAVMLPYRPVWAGLAINTALFTVLWTGPLLVFLETRRACRVWRARCPRCAYDVSQAAHERCPECGERLRRGGSGRTES